MAVAIERPATREGRALSLRVLDALEHLFILLPVLERPDLRALIEPVIDDRFARELRQLLAQRIIKRARRIDTLGGKDDLPCIDSRGRTKIGRTVLYVALVK